ncbi:MAG TPA: hypothetical protein VFT22_46140 [Kofleriaceae bacterium]|nr:hypothetical protein [Kofleriaceae bacterium]
MTGDPGGTALPQRGFPLSPILVAVGVAAAIILAFGLRGSGKKTEAAAALAPEPVAAEPPRQRRLVRVPTVTAAPAAPAVAVPDARAVTGDLETALRQQRLWGRVEINGPRIDVRSGSCADPAMQPLIEGKQSLLHGAGLTKLRCLEQSGAVVFDRDL